MRILNTLYVDEHQARVTVRDRSVEVRVDGKLRGRFPMAELESVVLTGSSSVTTETLARCTRQGVSVVAVSRGGGVRFMVSGPTKGNVLLRVAQCRAHDDPVESVLLAKDFVAGKLQNYRRLLQRWAWDAEGLSRELIEQQRDALGDSVERLRNSTDGDAVRGVEGEGTRRYFKGLGVHLEQSARPFLFLQRTRRPPRDPVNALLGYLYGLLVAQMVGALDAVGLDPQIGFLHGLRPGRPSLALDLVEEFRPSLADRFAVSLLTRSQLRPEHFTEAAGGAWYLGDSGRRIVLARWEEYRTEEVPHLLLKRELARSALPLVQATILARRLRGDISTYVPYLMER
jgi:CRISP-associated protein Cas1